jgi:hypothetical protein
MFFSSSAGCAAYVTAPYTAYVSDHTAYASESEEAPPIDPTAVHLAYRQAQAARRARIEGNRRRRLAGMRFWSTLLLLLAGGAAIAYGVWRELQHLLGG